MSASPALEVPSQAEVALTNVAQAQRALKDAEVNLDAAVAAARVAGLSWPTIAKALSAD
jgi:hypothetical protein